MARSVLFRSALLAQPLLVRGPGAGARSRDQNIILPRLALAAFFVRRLAETLQVGGALEVDAKWSGIEEHSGGDAVLKEVLEQVVGLSRDFLSNAPCWRNTSLEVEVHMQQLALSLSAYGSVLMDAGAGVDAGGADTLPWYQAVGALVNALGDAARGIPPPAFTGFVTFLDVGWGTHSFHSNFDPVADMASGASGFGTDVELSQIAQAYFNAIVACLDVSDLRRVTRPSPALFVRLPPHCRDTVQGVSRLLARLIRTTPAPGASKSPGMISLADELENLLERLALQIQAADGRLHSNPVARAELERALLRARLAVRTSVQQLAESALLSKTLTELMPQQVSMQETGLHRRPIDQLGLDSNTASPPLPVPRLQSSPSQYPASLPCSPTASTTAITAPLPRESYDIPAASLAEALALAPAGKPEVSEAARAPEGFLSPSLFESTLPRIATYKGLARSCSAPALISLTLGSSLQCSIMSERKHVFVGADEASTCCGASGLGDSCNGEDSAGSKVVLAASAIGVEDKALDCQIEGTTQEERIAPISSWRRRQVPRVVIDLTL